MLTNNLVEVKTGVFVRKFAWLDLLSLYGEVLGEVVEDEMLRFADEERLSMEEDAPPMVRVTEDGRFEYAAWLVAGWKIKTESRGF